MKKHNNNMIYGINSSLSVLDSDNCVISKISIVKNSQAYKNLNIEKIIKKRNLSSKLSFVNKISQDKGSKSIRSQGIIVEFLFIGLVHDFDAFIFSEKRHDCVLILDQLEDPQNLGQIIRTCECAGVDKIILTKDRSVSLSDTSLQISQGAFTNIKFYI